MHKSLLVDRNYMALSIISWKRAAKLLVTGKAEPIETEHNRLIKTSKGRFVVSSIIRLLVSVPWRAHSNRIKFSRRNVMIRDNYKCFYCDKSLSSSSKTIDHIIPRSKGGETTYTNCVACCKACNNKKGNLTLEQVGFKLKEKPKRPSFVALYRNHLKDYSPKEWDTYIIGV